LPIHVGTLDTAILLFGRLFTVAGPKHKLQVISHFYSCLNPKGLKPGSRIMALQINILSAMCYAMKTISENKGGKIEGEELKGLCGKLALPFLTSENIVLKCISIEALGRISQAIAEPHVIRFKFLNFKVFF
jgi:hypothetical protein